jgi:hypothetical protein
MKFLFFIPLLLAVVSGLPLDKLIKDPASLVATLQNVDPLAIEELQKYVVQLVAEGEADEAMYTQNRDDAKTDAGVKTDELAAALAALNTARDIHDAATNKEADASADEQSKKAVRAAKLGILNEKKAVLAEAKETNKNEQARLNREKSLFEEIKGLLTKVKATVEVGRHLLVDEDADPAQVETALKLLDDLIAEGETERQAVIDAEAAAQSAHDAARSVWANAVEIHTLAEGALADAQLEWQDAKDVLDLRTEEHATATENKNDADAHLAAEEIKLSEESKRIASEKIDLEVIASLLAKLE